MREIYKKISELNKEKKVCVLATMIVQTGSSPRGAGTKMLILEDGSIVGTIGGGLLEGTVMDEGKKVLETLKPSLISHKMQGADLDANEMICGGNAEIFLEPILPDNTTQLDIFKEISAFSRKGGSGLLVTVLNTDRWSKTQVPRMFIPGDDDNTGALPGMENAKKSLKSEIAKYIDARVPQVISVKDDEGKDVKIFVEPVISEAVVYLFGGGHVSKQIGPIAHLVGFSVVVIDDREEFSNPENFPYAKETITSSFDNIVEKLPINDSSYLIIVTRGHSHDKTVLAQCLKTPAKYIGMIGSSRKRRIIYEKLLREGFTQDQLRTVYSPIGMEIAAETPEEIAVAIVGELIKVRAGGE